MFLKRLGQVLLIVAAAIGVCSPAFWLGQYKSDQDNAAAIEKLQSTVQYLTESHNRALRDQRDEMLKEKNADIERYMLLCKAAATESKVAATTAKQAAETTKGVLETVKESQEAQVESIKETMEKAK